MSARFVLVLIFAGAVLALAVAGMEGAALLVAAVVVALVARHVVSIRENDADLTDEYEDPPISGFPGNLQ